MITPIIAHTNAVTVCDLQVHICVYTCSHITVYVLAHVHVVSLCVGVYIMCAHVYAHECLVTQSLFIFHVSCCPGLCVADTFMSAQCVTV